MIYFLLCHILLASSFITDNISGIGDVTFKAPSGTVLYISGQNTYQGNTNIIGDVVISSPQNLPHNGTIYLGGINNLSHEASSHLLLNSETAPGTLTIEGSNVTLPNITSNHPKSAISVGHHVELSIQGSITGPGISLQGNGSYSLKLTNLTAPLNVSSDVILK